MNNANLINQDSGNYEYYTPPKIIEAATEVLGRIDLDPSSCEDANKIVQAATIFTKNDNGLLLNWYGKIWMNPPFSRKDNKLWVPKLIKEYKIGNVTEAICITYASTSEQWFLPLHDFVQCYLYKRVKFITSEGQKDSPTKGCVLTYFGKKYYKFAEAFNKHGSIKVPWKG